VSSSDKPQSGCNRVWEFCLVRHVASFVNETSSEIHTIITEIRILTKHRCHRCPGCNTLCEPFNSGYIRLRCPICSKDRGSPYDFCWACQRQWKSVGTKCCGNIGCDEKDPRIRTLSNAEKITIDNISGCPGIRACPKCGLLIQQDGGCRHMTCTDCQAEFCFICLRRWKSNNEDLSFTCRVAPIQSEILPDPLWETRDSLRCDIPSRDSSCVIL